MKSRITILSLLLTGAAISASAQTKEHYYSEKAKDNIFISVGVGAQGCANPDNFDHGFGHAVTPLIHALVGRLFNPIWGIRGQVAGRWSTSYSEYGTPEGEYNKMKNKKYFTSCVDGLLNLSNVIGGYNPDRLFAVSAFADPGLTFAKAYGNQDKPDASINDSVGLTGQFNVDKYLDVSAEARGEVSPSVFGRYSSAHMDGAVFLTAGVTYTFGGKRFVSCGARADQSVVNEELNRYRSELPKAQSDLVDAKNALANMKFVTKGVVEEVEVAGPRTVFLQIGKSRIDDYGMVNIQLAVKILKANPDKKYKVVGYTDEVTGSAKWNQKLSEARAQAVCDAPIKESVSKDQLELIGLSGTADTSGKNFLNRAVILG